MENIITTAEITYNNKELAKITAQIISTFDTIKTNGFKIAHLISVVADNELYKDDGFATVHDWTRAAFGIKKSESYAMLKIGREWIQTEKVGICDKYHSNLVELGEDDFTVSQAIVMLPLGNEVAVENVDNGVITPDMTCAEIRKAVKAIQTADEEPTEEQTVEEEPADEQVVPVEMVTVFDDRGNLYRIPSDILSAYLVRD